MDVRTPRYRLLLWGRPVPPLPAGELNWTWRKSNFADQRHAQDETDEWTTGGRSWNGRGRRSGYRGSECSEELTEDERAILDDSFDDLEADHEVTAAHFERIATLTGGSALSVDACPNYQRILDYLETFVWNTLSTWTQTNLLFLMVE